MEEFRKTDAYILSGMCSTFHYFAVEILFVLSVIIKEYARTLFV